MTPRTFEEAYTQLETVVARLEAGGLGLDETMALYAEGVALVRDCTARIEAAELQLTEIADGDEDSPF